MKKILALLIMLMLTLTCFVGVMPVSAAALQIGDTFDYSEAFASYSGTDFEFGFYNYENGQYEKATGVTTGSGNAYYSVGFQSWTRYRKWASSQGLQMVYVNEYDPATDAAGFNAGDLLMCVSYHPYIRFTAPADGLYSFEADARLLANTISASQDGVQLKYITNWGNTVVKSKFYTSGEVSSFDTELFLKAGDRVYLTADPGDSSKSGNDEIIIKSYNITYKDTATVSNLTYDVARDFDKDIFPNFFEFGTIDKTTKAFTSEMSYWKSVQDDPATTEDESYYVLCDGTAAHVNGYAPQGNTYKSHLSVGKIIDDEFNRQNHASNIGKVSWKSVGDGKDKVVKFKAPYDGYYYIEYSPCRMWASANQTSRFYIMYNGIVYDQFIKRADNTPVNFKLPIYLSEGEAVYFGYDENGSTSTDNAWLDLKVTLYDGTLTDYTCAHTGGTATCSAQAICTKCGEPYGEKASTHSSTELVWTYDDDSHSATHKCCGAEAVADTAHTLNNGVCECGYGCQHDGGKIIYTVNGDTHSSKYDCCGKVVDTDVDHDFTDGDCDCGAKKPIPQTGDTMISVSVVLAVISIIGFSAYTKKKHH